MTLRVSAMSPLHEFAQIQVRRVPQRLTGRSRMVRRAVPY